MVKFYKETGFCEIIFVLKEVIIIFVVVVVVVFVIVVVVVIVIIIIIIISSSSSSSMDSLVQIYHNKRIIMKSWIFYLISPRIKTK